jgi:hypothetical protein
MMKNHPPEVVVVPFCVKRERGNEDDGSLGAMKLLQELLL